ncbi:MAG: hypothetical protein PF570_04520 [Candidatus Cloacimonetes bacterium]|jgi:hypothetical protein|nr:hypothetical protein [Candidatus Cloacimonadota bacterium]
MIRIYLDWNVISNLKKTEFQDVYNFIKKHKDKLLFPYSPAHFNDLMKSYSPENEFFEMDLETLNYLSGKHLIRWEETSVKPLFGTPKEYFENEKDKEDIFSLMDIDKIFNDLNVATNEIGLGDFGEIVKGLYQIQPSGVDITPENEKVVKKMFPNLKPNSSMWDFMKDMGQFSKNLLQDRDYYKDFRKTSKEQGLKLKNNHGNWTYDEVIKNIDDFLGNFNTKMTYLDYVKTVFKFREKPMTDYEYYTTAYLMLDMIGYKSDKLPKVTDNMQNIQTDGEHSFYGAHCDFFVAMDKKLRIKSKVLYNEFNVPTKIIEPEQLISELKKILYIPSKEHNFLKEVLTFCSEENLIKSYPKADDDEVETFIFKLPSFYFNFFNYLVLRNYQDKGSLIFTFKKVFKNFSRFIYYTESEMLINSIVKVFGYNNDQELNKKKKEFVYEDNDTSFDWSFDQGFVKLIKDEETKRPLLNIIISTDVLTKES